MSRFPNNLKAYRLQTALTQVEVAEKIGVSRSRLSLWEVGRELPDWPVLEQLMRLYEETLDNLYPVKWVAEIIAGGKPNTGIQR